MMVSFFLVGLCTCICRTSSFYAFALLVYQFLYSYLFYNKYCNILFDLVFNYHIQGVPELADQIETVYSLMEMKVKNV
jgi:uncharacterized membrane protein (UPF0182 family)